MRRAGAVMIGSVTAAGLIASGGSAVATNDDPHRRPSSVASLAPLATYDVPGEVAEIVAASEDGHTLVYTDSEDEQVGVVDISDPAAPTGAGTVDVGGEPTSVAVLGDLALVAVDGPDDLAVVDLASAAVVARVPLGGQPDSVALDASGRWAAVAVENQRDEDADEGRRPQPVSSWWWTPPATTRRGGPRATSTSRASRVRASPPTRSRSSWTCATAWRP